ncbi:MAG TPA: zinc-ribbon and DUF3426 domain-containing protein [Steroidobacteraceae bacterium]|jgi:predicted Zn finger-like uncharacterized protein|nr:zinc-ribbon and DUF3426 domain-containing protein [Steroidobacteraceae bacterium]
MFTVCPKCALTLVVTAADLRVAQGYVRCGRCSSVFNALARLTDERQGTAPGSEAEAPPPAVESPEPAADAAETGAPSQHTVPPADAVPALADEEAIPDDAEEAIPDDALEFNPATTDVGSVFVEPPPDPQWTAETGSFRAMIAASEPEQEESPQPEVDVEIDAAFLASMLHGDDTGTAREPAAAGQSQAPPPSPAAPPQRPPPASGEPRQREPPQHEPPQREAPRGEAPRRQPLQREPPQRELPQRAADSPAAAARTAAAGGRPAARHTARHTRPGTGAAARPSPAALRARTPIRERATTAPHAEEAPAAPAPEQSPLTPYDADAPTGAAGAASSLRHVWGVGTAVAALLFTAQIVNHYRDELAASARFNRPLTALYSALGVRLVPRWDLHAYDVRQLGASVDPAGPGLITVRASIKNAAQQAQPLPLLRVTLQDRFGNRIASSDVAPRSYLPHAVPASSFLAGGQRIDAEMGFVDPGANAVGFEIDACLPASGGGVACANDAGPR